MNKVNLLNKRILYIGEIMFHYDKYIVDKLIDLKAKVDAFEIYPTQNNLYFRLLKKLKLPAIELYKQDFYNKILIKKDYDYVLIKTGHQLDNSFLEKLKNLNPNAKFINFHWDSIRAEYDYLHIMKFFDKIYSFDYRDAQTNNEINYLPLFYIDEYLEHGKIPDYKKKEIDLLFIGSWRDTERYQLVKSTQKICKQNQLRFYYYLNYPFKAQFDSLKKGIIAKESRHRKLSHKEILKLFSISNTIIDFPSSFQTGLTIRTFEALGAGKKLITINKNIMTEPFYDPQYINVVDLNNFDLNIDFIKNIPTSSIQDKMKNYSLENYINKLLQ